MQATKLGIELASLRLPFKQALHTAATLGVDAVEIDARNEISPRELSRTGVRQLRKMLDDLNLRVASVSFRTRRGYDTEEELEARVAATKAAMDMAYNIGAGVVINRVGRIPADPEARAWKLLVEVLADLGRYGQRAGALLAAEAGAESGEDLARLFAALPEGALGIDLNPGNLLLSGHSPLDAATALRAWILHVHVSDAVCGAAPGLGKPAAVGQGDADFPALFSTLQVHGYRGYFTIQQQIAGDLAGAVEYLRRL